MYSDLAIEVSRNATALRQLIAELQAEQDELGASVNRTNSVVEAAESALQRVSYIAKKCVLEGGMNGPVNQKYISHNLR